MANPRDNQSQPPLASGPIYAPGVPELEGKDLLDPKQITQTIEKLKELEGLKDQVKELKESRIRYVEILGIFVALFTFVSINIQIFSKITSLNNALVFIILMFLCLSGFVFLLHLVLSVKKNLTLIFSLIAIGGLLVAVMFKFLLPNTPLSIEETSELKQVDQRLSNLEKMFEVLLRTEN